MQCGDTASLMRKGRRRAKAPVAVSLRVLFWWLGFVVFGPGSAAARPPRPLPRTNNVSRLVVRGAASRVAADPLRVVCATTSMQRARRRSVFACA